MLASIIISYGLNAKILKLLVLVIGSLLLKRIVRIGIVQKI